MRVNLHTHSTVSDGTLSPSEIVHRLQQDGVVVMALTDHDKIDGLAEARTAATHCNLRLINGVEISAQMRDFTLNFLNTTTDSLHLLGLGFDDIKLMAIYQEKRLLKQKRLEALNQTLIKNGFNIPVLADLDKRTQIANALVTKGYASSTHEAFETIINHYYDPWIDSVGVKEAVDMIHSAGGLILWAHPYEILRSIAKVHLDNEQIEQLCISLKALEIDGIEVYYQIYSPAQTEYLQTLQKKFEFIASAGTDYHAKANQPNTFIDIDPRKIKEVLE